MSTAQIVLGVLVPLCSTALTYVKWRSGMFGLSNKRTQRLYALCDTGRWRDAGPAALQIAVSNAIGTSLDADQIRIALERSNALRVLGHCKLAKGTVRVSPDRSGFEPLGRYKRARDYRIAAVICYAIATLPWPIAAITFPLLNTPRDVAIAIVASLPLITIFATWLSLCLESAYQLTHEFDHNYPRFRLPNGPADSLDPSRSDHQPIEAPLSRPIGQLTPVPPRPQ